MDWIDLPAIGKILGFGLLAGAGLPVLFAAGMLSLSLGPRTTPATATATAGPGGGVGRGGGKNPRDTLVGGNPAGIAGAAICFAIVLAAIAWGVYEIYRLGHPHH